MRTQIELVKTEMQVFKGCFTYDSARLEYANYGVYISDDEFDGVVQWSVGVTKVVRSDAIKRGFCSFEEARTWLDEHFWVEGRDTSIDLPSHNYQDDPEHYPASDAAWAGDFETVRAEIDEEMTALKNYYREKEKYLKELDRKHAQELIEKQRESKQQSDNLAEQLGFGDFKDKLHIHIVGRESL